MSDNYSDMPANNYYISPFPNDPVVAMAYIPYQNPVSIYSAEKGLKSGTLFPCLYKPFYGCEVCRK